MVCWAHTALYGHNLDGCWCWILHRFTAYVTQLANMHSCSVTRLPELLTHGMYSTGSLAKEPEFREMSRCINTEQVPLYDTDTIFKDNRDGCKDKIPPKVLLQWKRLVTNRSPPRMDDSRSTVQHMRKVTEPVMHQRLFHPRDVVLMIICT